MLYNQPVGETADAPYVTGVPGVTQGSVPPGAAIEDPQREILAVIEGGGLTPSDADLAQMAQVIQGDLLKAANGGGTADAITAAFNLSVSALVHGMRLLVKVVTPNATATPTFTPNSGVVAAKTIVKGNDIALVPGDVLGWVEVAYDSTLDKWVLMNPVYGVKSSIGYKQTWQVVSRSLNVTYYNTTAQPIMVSATYQMATGTTSISVDGVLACRSGGYTGYGQVSAIVPPGSSYVMTVDATNTLVGVQELR